MFDSIPAPETVTPPDDTGARERLRRLRRLADIGVRIAERMDRQSELSAVYAETCAVPEHLHAAYARRIDEIGRAFAQVCRAVALATALEDRIETDLHAGPAARAEQVLKRRLLSLRVAAAEPPAASPARDDAAPGPARLRAPNLNLDLNPRLDRALDPGLDALDAELAHPLEEILARVRRTLDRAGDAAPAAASEPAASPVPRPFSRREKDGPAAPERSEGPQGRIRYATRDALAPRSAPHAAHVALPPHAAPP